MKEIKKENNILIFATVISIITYLFWDLISDFGYDIYYIGNALCVFLLAVYIKRVTPKSFITFFLVCITLSNLIDELFFDNTKFGINEILATIILPIYYYLNERTKQ